MKKTRSGPVSTKNGVTDQPLPTAGQGWKGMTRVSVRSICNRGNAKSRKDIYIYVSVYISLILLPLKCGPKWTRLTPRSIYAKLISYKVITVPVWMCRVESICNFVSEYFGENWARYGTILTDLLYERDMVTKHGERMGFRSIFFIR